MAKPTDIRAAAAELFFLPVETRMPLKFGPETLTHVTCARARLTVRLASGGTAIGAPRRVRRARATSAARPTKRSTSPCIATTAARSCVTFSE